jgi:hypothetical protein
VCWTMWVREGFNTTATKEFQIIWEVEATH